MTRTAKSRNGVPIRLTDERWMHIVDEHAELEGMREAVLLAVSDAQRVLAGASGELLAVYLLEADKALVVVYKELSANDGFVITAFMTSRIVSLDRRRQVWPPTR